MVSLLLKGYIALKMSSNTVKIVSMDCQAEWGYKCFFASYSSSLRSVAILVYNSLEFSVKKVHKVKILQESTYSLL